jgi:hypothetical protein
LSDPGNHDESTSAVSMSVVRTLGSYGEVSEAADSSNNKRHDLLQLAPSLANAPRVTRFHTTSSSKASRRSVTLMPNFHITWPLCTVNVLGLVGHRVR